MGSEAQFHVPRERQRQGGGLGSAAAAPRRRALAHPPPTPLRRLVALMGPSGSGKTSLLNALAGQVPHSGGIALSGSVTVNGAPASEQNHK